MHVVALRGYLLEGQSAVGVSFFRRNSLPAMTLSRISISEQIIRNHPPLFFLCIWIFRNGG